MNVDFSINILTFLFKIIERLTRADQENMRNLRRALGAEGRIADLNFEIRSLKYQLNNK
jgi:hypothetical protein